MSVVLVARLSHETNTFARPFAQLEDFSSNVHGTGAQGFLDEVAKRSSLKVFTSVIAGAMPCGPVEHLVYEQFVQKIVADVASVKPAAILLDLHGAMVTTKIDDGEGELLQRIRAVAPICPIGVCLDLHGNTTKLMLDNSSFMASYQTYPHIDMRETGCRVARVVLDRLLAESVSLSKVLIQIPVLASTLCSRTDVDGPMLRAVNAAKHLEDRGLVVSASILAGFPLSDVEFAGISIVGYSTSEDSLQVVMKDLAQQIESERELFVFRPEPAQISVDHLINAVSLPNRQSYVALLDHADNVMSGGSASSAEVLRLLLERGRAAAPFLVGPIFDAKFVESLPADAKHVHWRPTQVTKELVVQGTIQAVSDGTFVVTGPILTGSTQKMGKSVALALDGGSVVVVSSKPVEPFDIGVFSCLGIVDLRQFAVIVFKSRMYCRPVFVRDNPVVLIDCGGITSSHYSGFSFEKLRRPIFPLDFALTLEGALAGAKTALARHALAPISTEVFRYHDGEFDFSVLVVSSLRLKPKSNSGGLHTPKDPFDPPEPLLLIESKLPNHFLVLNKFPVIQGHVLLVTKTFASQNDYLTFEDFEALSLCSDGRGWLAFYNCGPESGRSQPHKHLQLVPYPFADATCLKQVQNLPFVHAMERLDSWRDAKALFSMYRRLIDACGTELCSSHNVLITDSSMLVVPRSKESFEGAGINACAFAFSVLVSSNETRLLMEKEGMVNVLKSVTFSSKQNSKV